MITLPKSILIDEGRNNLGGLLRTIAYTFVEDIKTFPKPIVDINGTGDLLDLGVISDDIEMVDTKEFNTLEITDESGNLKETAEGDTDSKVTTEELTFMIPGDKKKINALVRLFKHKKAVFLLPERATDDLYLFGSKRIPARYESHEFVTGGKGNERKAVTFTFKRTDDFGAPVFKGRIIKEPIGPTYQSDIDFIPSV